MFRAEVHGGGSGHCKNKICDVCIYVIIVMFVSM